LPVLHPNLLSQVRIHPDVTGQRQQLQATIQYTLYPHESFLSMGFCNFFWFHQYLWRKQKKLHLYFMHHAVCITPFHKVQLSPMSAHSFTYLARTGFLYSLSPVTSRITVTKSGSSNTSSSSESSTSRMARSVKKG